MTTTITRFAVLFAASLSLGPAGAQAADAASPMEVWRMGPVLTLVPDQAWQQAELLVVGSALALGPARAGEVLTFSPLPASCSDVVLQYVDEGGWGVTVYLEIDEQAASSAKAAGEATHPDPRAG